MHYGFTLFMNFSWPRLKRQWLILATGLMTLAATAQESGQMIIFSSPKTDGAPGDTPSLTPKNSTPSTLPDTLLAPMSIFSPPPTPNPLLPSGNSAGQQRLKQWQEERRNWTLMTPAEIFGVTTPDSLLPPSERDAFGRKKKTTQQERYINRENEARLGATNDWSSRQNRMPWGLSDAAGVTDSFARRRDGLEGPPKNSSPFLDSQQNKTTAANPFGLSDATASRNAFDPFAQKKATQEKLEQQASMQRFREMLAPSAEPAPNNRFFPVPKPARDPNLTHLEFTPNPAGASFKPLTSNLGRPIGLTPLPGVVTPRIQPVVIPSWKPQPPPWASQTPPTTAFPKLRY